MRFYIFFEKNFFSGFHFQNRLEFDNDDDNDEKEMNEERKLMTK